jgi:exonuclease VII small subunit
MISYEEMKNAIDKNNVKSIEDYQKLDSYVMRYNLGVYDLDEQLRILNRAVMAYLTSDKFLQDASKFERKEANILPHFLNDLTEVMNHVRRTQEAYEDIMQESRPKKCKEA